MRGPLFAGAVLVAFTGSALAQALPGPSDDKPLTEKWAPSKWGANDRAGSANHTKNPENVKRALATVKQFKSLTVGKYYHREIARLRRPRMAAQSFPERPPAAPSARTR